VVVARAVGGGGGAGVVDRIGETAMRLLTGDTRTEGAVDDEFADIDSEA
jgi:hypothetical protein